MNALSFELDYEQELVALWEEINTGTYQPGRSIAFIVDKPVKREIFAADFRDRVVHHLLNKLNPLFERTFIYDSYACRKGRGAHFGIQRIDRFIRQCSENYTKECYVLRLDIQGFFMAIDKRTLWIKLRGLITNQYQQPDKYRILSLCHKILSNNPTKHCFIKGSRHNWRDYDAISQYNQVTQSHKPSREEQAAFLCSMDSYLGILKHYNTYHLRKRMLIKHLSAWW